MLTFDVVYLNQRKQIKLITITASDRKAAFKATSDRVDCRKYHGVPNITSINQRACASL